MRSNNNNKVLKYILNTFVVFVYIYINMAKMTRTKIDILFYFVKTIIERTNGREKKNIKNHILRNVRIRKLLSKVF